MAHIITFSHPDYTVGFGFSPNLSLVDVEAIKERLAGSAQHLSLFHTAGRELHPAPKVLFVISMPQLERNMQVLPQNPEAFQFSDFAGYFDLLAIFSTMEFFGILIAVFLTNLCIDLAQEIF
ncbi:hypothetical protein KDW_00850 [Dictyobacter vulcani]|uniref:Uncharacterized protein n=1 Tax=Dictyobacter vulcani TaxID=2607529 RepID=A0A5J4KEJ0_9CHLR|nr:hypothetical protein KDW_00850 [Dictyobacter vulcani]